MRPLATVIPTITNVFHSIKDVGWYGSAYLLALASLQPTFGKLYSVFDLKIVYLIALFIFEGQLALCSSSASSSTNSVSMQLDP